jgi:Uma2 family endonuclease
MKRVGRTNIEGPVDRAVEIISPDSGERDRSRKYAAYEESRVKEFCLIDPDEKAAEFFQLCNSRPLDRCRLALAGPAPLNG